MGQLRSDQLTGSLSGISFSYTSDPVEKFLSDEDILAVVSFGHGCDIESETGHIHCGLTSLGEPLVKEVWRSSAPIRKGGDKSLFWSETDELLVVGVSVDEKEHADLRSAINVAYKRLLEFTGDHPCSHIIRMWSYIADINQGDDELERYRQFCYGRHEAMTEMGFDPKQFPSACALGHAGEGNVVYLLASNRAGINFENPRQMSAYQYPREYGPRSPSFARATLVEWKEERQLYLSGTASILGHQSIYPDNIQAQLETTCQNIDFLLTHVAEQLGEKSVPKLSMLKVYIRHKSDYSVVAEGVHSHFGGVIPTVFLEADICRKELLVEIDGLCLL
ncbi:uncharacterized domain / RidA/YER057c/UK114 superfamily, group 5 [hydrothermal vent metagenome]|uniref:Uncharacterized domain / RidA/YER057c/UK114 superfamily, group 5 n=1 Tax=hydrothermal vent metagenome TaxID=652676 RepID=A0A3B1A7K0_9ZZZZ